MINPKAEIVLITTSLTVLRSESEDSGTVESLSLSQKQHDELGQIDDRRNVLKDSGIDSGM